MPNLGTIGVVIMANRDIENTEKKVTFSALLIDFNKLDELCIKYYRKVHPEEKLSTEPLIEKLNKTDPDWRKPYLILAIKECEKKSKQDQIQQKINAGIVSKKASRAPILSPPPPNNAPAPPPHAAPPIPTSTTFCRIC